MHTVNSLHQELKRIVTNLPDGIVSIDLRLRSDELPTMKICVECASPSDPSGPPLVVDGHVQTETKTFRLLATSCVRARIDAVIDADLISVEIYDGRQFAFVTLPADAARAIVEAFAWGSKETR